MVGIGISIGIGKRVGVVIAKLSLFTILLITLGCYFIICYLVSISEFAQSLLIYLNLVRWPLFNAELKDVRSQRIVQARNLMLEMKDGIRIHGYHLPPMKSISAHLDYYNQALESMSEETSPEDMNNQFYNNQLAKAERIVVFFHGNGASRAFYHRIHIIKQLADLLDAHVITFDYRGFADSEGWPSEAKIRHDSVAIIEWLSKLIHSHDCEVGEDRVCRRPKVYLYGQSLGTAIATELAVDINHHRLHASAIQIDGLILDSPFASVLHAIESYPLAQLFRIIPFVEKLLIRSCKVHYPTIERIHLVKSPILIVHGIIDEKISIQNSYRLLEAAVRSGVYYEQDYRFVENSDSTDSARNDPHYPIYLQTIAKAHHNNAHQFLEWFVSLPAFIRFVERDSTNLD